MTDTVAPAAPKDEVLHVQAFPSYLKQRAKAAAALKGQPLREWLTKVVGDAVEKAEKNKKKR